MSRSFGVEVPAVPMVMPPGQRRSWLRLPDQLRQSFLFGGDDPSGDVGMKNHESIVCSGTPERQ